VPVATKGFFPEQIEEDTQQGRWLAKWYFVLKIRRGRLDVWEL